MMGRITKYTEEFKATPLELIQLLLETMSRKEVAAFYNVSLTAVRVRVAVKKVAGCSHAGPADLVFLGRYSVTKRCSECSQLYTRWKEGISTDDIFDGFLGGADVQ